MSTTKDYMLAIIQTLEELADESLGVAFYRIENTKRWELVLRLVQQLRGIVENDQ